MEFWDFCGNPALSTHSPIHDNQSSPSSTLTLTDQSVNYTSNYKGLDALKSWYQWRGNRVAETFLRLLWVEIWLFRDWMAKFISGKKNDPLFVLKYNGIVISACLSLEYLIDIDTSTCPICTSHSLTHLTKAAALNPVEEVGLILDKFEKENVWKAKLMSSGKKALLLWICPDVLK